ncbi:hypothetical protein D3C76_1298540 [compost metagenome]
MQLLRHVANAQFGLTPDFAIVGLEQPQHGPHQCRLTGTVGADQRHDLARFDTQVDVVQYRLPSEVDGNLLQLDQCGAHQDSRQLEQRPTTSTV